MTAEYDDGLMVVPDNKRKMITSGKKKLQKMFKELDFQKSPVFRQRAKPVE